MSDKSRAPNTLPEGAGFAMSKAGMVNAAIVAAGNILKMCMMALKNFKTKSGSSNNSSGSEMIEVNGDDITTAQMGR